MEIIFGLSALFGWGVTDFLAALVSRKIGNVSAVFWSTIGGLILMLLYFSFTHGSFVIPLSALLILLISGILQAMGGLSFYKALEVGKVSLASPIASSFAMWTVLLSLIFLHEKLTSIQAIAVVLVLCGTFLVSSNLKLLKKDLTKAFSDKGVLLAFLASIFWGVSFTIYSPILREYGWLPSVISLRVSVLIGTILFALIFRQKITFKPNKRSVRYLFIMSFTDVVAYFGYSIGLEHGYTAVVSPVAAAFPFVTVLLARIILKEKIVLNQFLGIVAIIGGVILLSL